MHARLPAGQADIKRKATLTFKPVRDTGKACIKISCARGHSRVYFWKVMEEKVILDSDNMSRTLRRLAHEIIEQNDCDGTIYLVGIKRRGVPIAEALKENIEKFSDIRAELGELDITLYRDDLTERYTEPKLNESVIPFDVNGKNIIMVDDVLFTGRTARAGMDALVALGRPSKIQLLVMVDRGHRELPIRANYVGKNVPTSRSEFVAVRVLPIDGKEEIAILKDGDEAKAYS